VPTTESLAITSESGNNWATLPVFYDGPTSTSYWVDEVGYWGVGEWDNATQTNRWDWPEPGYEPFEMEPCGAYDMVLPGNACTTNADCTGDQFCFYVEAAACGDVAAGLCMGRPLGCENAPEDPVCGCDGQEYASLCEADFAGVGMRRPAGAGGCDTPQVCGDGYVDPGEQCDGAELAEATCESLGFDAGGTLACTAACTFDTAACADTPPLPACAEQDLGEAIGAAVASGSTVGEDDDLPQTCGASGGADRVLRFIAPANGTFQFDTVGSTYDTVLSLHAGCGVTPIVCNDDFTGLGLRSQVTLAMTAGQEVLVAVSGYNGQTGSWILNVSQI
jgi:hypothetical protein